MYRDCTIHKLCLVLLAACAWLCPSLDESGPSALATAATGPALVPDETGPSPEVDEANGVMVEEIPDEASDSSPRASDVYLISTRRRRYTGDQPRLEIWHYGQGAWQPSSLEEFLASDDPSRPTCFWVHGNRVNSAQASWYGWRVYKRLKATRPKDRPFRFVIWSWPASQVKGQARDVRLKAFRSDGESYPLAWLVNQMNPRVPVGLIGYSFGARVVSGALHVLGGGQLRGQQLAERVQARRRLRAVLMAGAFENFWLARGGRHQYALSQVEKMVVMFNRDDPVLRWYRMIYGFRLAGGPQAIGSTGIAGRLGALRDRLQQVDVGRAVGSTHDWRSYVSATGLMRGTATLALYEDASLGSEKSDKAEAPRSGREHGTVSRPASRAEPLRGTLRSDRKAESVDTLETAGASASPVLD